MDQTHFCNLQERIYLFDLYIIYIYAQLFLLQIDRRDQH